MRSHPFASVGLRLAAITLFAAFVPGLLAAVELPPRGGTGAAGLEPVAAHRVPIGFDAARSIASRWLSRERCRAVFGDFRDSAGRPLSAVLEETGRTPEGRLLEIEFSLGGDEGRCRDSEVLAVMSSGSTAVRLCAAAGRLARRDPPSLAVVLLHEELHSLGLGEDPPTSREISRAIEAGCR